MNAHDLPADLVTADGEHEDATVKVAAWGNVVNLQLEDGPEITLDRAELLRTIAVKPCRGWGS